MSLRLAASAAIVAAVLAGQAGAASASWADSTPSPHPTPTTTAAPNPYAQEEHRPGDEDSDPTWVWLTGGVIFIVLGTGFVLLLVFIRRIPDGPSG